MATNTAKSEIVSLEAFYELADNGQDIYYNDENVSNPGKILGDDYENTEVEIIYGAEAIHILKVIQNRPMYAHIIFLQENADAREALNLIHMYSDESAVRFLSQWDSGEYNEITPASPAGSRDITRIVGSYELSYNTGLQTVGLCRILTPEEYKLIIHE